MKTNSLTIEVVNHIEKWLASGINRNMSALARNSDVDVSCIRRILNNKSTPKSDNLLKILCYISSETTIEGLKSFFSHDLSVLGFLKSNFSFLENNKFLNSCKPLYNEEDIFDDSFSFAVFCLASCCGSNFKTKHIQEYFGMFGTLALNKLVSKNLITIDEHGYLHSANQNTRVSRDLIKKQIPFLTELFFKPDHIHNGSSLVIESVSKKGYALLMDAYEDFLRRVGDIVIENKGDIPTIISGFMDTMTPNNYFQEVKNEELN